MSHAFLNLLISSITFLNYYDANEKSNEAVEIACENCADIITQSIKWDGTHPWYVEICYNVAIIKYPAITRKIAQNSGIKAYV